MPVRLQAERGVSILTVCCEPSRPPRGFRMHAVDSRRFLSIPDTGSKGDSGPIVATTPNAPRPLSSHAGGFSRDRPPHKRCTVVNAARVGR